MDDGLVAVTCLGLADGRALDLAGAWLVWYKPEGNDGTGDAAWSHDPADAKLMTPEEWARLWTASPANRPLRSDGKPNRPITMFSLMVVPVAPGELPSFFPSSAGPGMPDPRSFMEAVYGGAQPEPPPAPVPRPPGPPPAEPVSLADEMRAMGLM